MKKIISIFIVVFTLTPFSAKAADTDFIILQKFTAKLYDGDYIGAEEFVNERSKPWLRRYAQHNLGDMTPVNFSLHSQSSNGGFRYLKVAGNDGKGNPKLMTTALNTENGASKIDLPETLRLGFGPQWEQRVNLIERGYNFAKLQFGETESREVLEQLIAQYSARK